MKPMIRRGFAPGFALDSTMSRTSARRHARYTRPATRILPWTPAEECGINIGRQLGRRRWLYATPEDSFLLVAPPGGGKTTHLASQGAGASGPLVAATTKADLLGLINPVRRHLPQYVLNPEGKGGVPSTFSVDLVAGCDDPDVAIMRAGHVMGGVPSSGKGGDREFWEDEAASVLRALLHAAALIGEDMRGVTGWARNMGDETPVEVLEHHPRAAGGWGAELRQVYELNPKTRQSIAKTLTAALSFMSSPALAAAACPNPELQPFDPEQFLDECGSLYLIATARKAGGLGPLFAAITGMIFETALHVAANRLGGRLDPPLTILLDEAPSICRVPLEQWTAVARGHGIILTVAVQSIAQLAHGWGAEGGEIIWGNCTVKMVFGGGGDERHLDGLVKLAGTRWARRRSYAAGGISDQAERVPIMAVEDIRELGPRQALVLYRATPPVVVVTRSVRDRRDYRKAMKQ